LQFHFPDPLIFASWQCAYDSKTLKKKMPTHTASVHFNVQFC
jgi:hypothetical protein